MKTTHRKAPVSRRMVNQSGNFNVMRKGISHKHWHDPYHLLLTLPWYHTLLLISLSYVLANALFALAFILGGDGIENARPGNFFDAFFFSVQTMASIGYGALYPKTAYANVLVTVESLIGLIGLAMGSGLMFARFSLPRARVLFSNIAVITPYNDAPTLMFRVANERENWILEAQVRVTLARTEISKEGDVMRRFYDMPLVRSQSPLFALTWTVMHAIDENSPLYGVTTEEMVEDEMEVVVTLTGIDETVSQTIHARHSYISEEIVWNMKFVDILGKTKDGRRCINYTRFHDVVSLDEETNGMGGC